MGESTHGEPPRPGYAPGDEIASKYRLVQQLGEGGMGAVWLARNLVLDVDVALKLIHRHLAVPEAPTLLLKEARTAAQLGHRSIVRVFDFGETERGDPYIVMEVLHGISLASMLERSSRTPPAEMVRTLLPIANALAAAHDRGVVHCDVKPENILLVTDEANAVVPKLVDFGIAKFSRADPTDAGSKTISGTPEYMSPEQVHGLEVLDGRTDVWSLSVVLYEALNGSKPFSGTTLAAQLSAILVQQPAPALHESPLLAEIIERGLAKDRTDRWPSMRAFGQALAGWARENGVETDVTGTSLSEQWPSELGRSSKPAISVQPVAPAVATEAHEPASLVRRASMADTERAVVPPRDRSTSATTAPILLIARASSPGASSDPADEEVAEPGPVPRKRRHPLVVAGLLLVPVALGAVGASSVGRPRVAAAVAWLWPHARSEPSASTAGAIESRPAAPSGAADRTDSPAAAATPRQEPDPPAAPQTSAIAPVSVGICVLPLLPGTFDPKEPPDLGRLCAETDPRRGAAAIRAEMVRAGRRRPATQGMREWAMLGWYELAATEVVRGRCCPDAPPVSLPAPTGSCGSLATALDALGAAVRTGDDTDPSVARFRAAANCELTSRVASVYAYRRPGGGEEDTLRKLLARATGKESAAAPPVRKVPPSARAVVPPASSAPWPGPATAPDPDPEPPVEEPYP